MNVPQKDKKLVINSFFASDTFIKVNISKSYTISEEIGTDKFINDATVKLYEDNVFKENMISVDTGNYVSSFKPTTGKTYKIDISHNIYPSASAETNVPAPVPFISIDTMHSGDKTTRRLKITFKDPSNETDYYWLKAYTLKDSTLGNEIYLWSSSLDENSDVDLRGVVFSDNNFNGTTFSFSVDLNYHDVPDSSSYVKIMFYHITKDMYQYLVSRPQLGILNALSEPTIAFTNIKNGYGIFSGYSCDTRIIMY